MVGSIITRVGIALTIFVTIPILCFFGYAYNRQRKGNGEIKKD